MKKIALVILSLATIAIGFAQTGALDNTTIRKIKTDENITSLKIYNNVEVIFTDDSNTFIQIVGEKSVVENTRVKLENGTLTVTGVADQFMEGGIVYVPARHLHEVYIHGGSSVKSAGLLKKELLEVSLNGEGKSVIQLTGALTVNTIGDFRLQSSPEAK